MAGTNRFDEFRRKLEALKSPRFQAELAQRCGAAAVKTTADCFRHSRDPYGIAWRALAMRQGQALRDTGALAASISCQPAQGTFKLIAPRKYAATHQYGAHIAAKNAKALRWKVRGMAGFFFAKAVDIPARPFFPDAARGIPPAMREAFAEAHSDLVKEYLAA